MSDEIIEWPTYKAEINLKKTFIELSFQVQTQKNVLDVNEWKEVSEFLA